MIRPIVYAAGSAVRFVVAVLLVAAVLPSSSRAQTDGVLPPGATAPSSDLDARTVRTTILPGTPVARPTPVPRVRSLPNGDITLNFPGVDVRAVTKAILGDTLGLRFAVDAQAQGPITLQTAHPIRKIDVLAVFEQALTAANLALTDRAGVYTVVPAASAKGEAPAVGPNDPGYGNETITLRFVNAEEMRKLLDPLVPNAISVADPTQNLLVVSGTSTQRTALRELVAQFDVDWLRGMSFALFVPQRTDARLIAPELEKLINAPGAQSAGLVRLIAMDRLNGILAITAQPQYLEDVRRFVEVLDREGEGAERRVFVYRVQNGRAADLAKVLGGAFGISVGAGNASAIEPTQLNDTSAPSPVTAPLSSAAGGAGGMVVGLPARSAARGGEVSRQEAEREQGATAGGGGATGMTITADETNNAIVLYATPRDFALVEDALRKLDVPPLQVFIDASISEVTLNHALQYGVQWAFQAGRLGGTMSQGSSSTQMITTGGVTTTLPNGTTITTPTNTVNQVVNPGPIQNFPGLSFLYQGNGFSAVLNALAQVTDVTVLSAPKLMVLNNHTATIEVGNQVPISTGSAVSTLSAGAPVVNSIEYRDTGIILKITPRVNSGGLVLLDIAQEVSDVSNTTSSSGIASPTIEQRKIATSVAVQDGETVALGGLIKNEVMKGRSAIPILDDIPVLGHLFGDTTGGLIRTELVVLLTPRVVRTPVDARAITEELKEKIHLASPPPPANAPPPTKAKHHGP